MKRMFVFGKRWSKTVFAVLLISSLLLASGCNVQAPEMTEPDPSASVEPETTGAGGVVEDSSVNTLRQEMVGTSQAFAAAYFGYQEPSDGNGTVDPYAVMKEKAHYLCIDMPFLLSIPEENIVGTSGDLFCIVPADPAATVAINRGVWNETGEECIYNDVVYRSEKGEPILLFCNNAGWEPDTQITVTGSDGTSVIWYPQLNDMLCLDMPVNDESEALGLDFTAYSESLSADYFNMLDAHWKFPVEEDLIGKTWGYNSCLKDGRDIRGLVTFDEEVCAVRWNDGIDEEDHEYLYAPWELTYDEGFALLDIDFGEFAGVLRYNLLMDKDSGDLYIALDVSMGTVETGWEPLYRILVQQTAPEPMEMVGTWELVWQEFEGNRSYLESNGTTIVITGDSETELRATYTDMLLNNESFQNKELTVTAEEMYFGCGNDQWKANVEYVGPYDTFYAITVLDDGTLLMQSYWEVDGAPTVSYSFFQRAA